MTPATPTGKMVKWTTIGLVATLLLVAVGAVVATATHTERPRFVAKLSDLLPRDAGGKGWSVTFPPIAETEEVQRAVNEHLNYDDAVYATYRSGETRISIYAAYWLPGKMPHRLIAMHTPDVCWVSGGWKRMGRAKREQISGADAAMTFEHRVFTKNGDTENVVFCHIVGERVMSYGTGAQPPWYAIYSDFLDKGLNQRNEQLFVRISSNRPYEEFKDAMPVVHFIAALHAASPRTFPRKVSPAAKRK